MIVFDWPTLMLGPCNHLSKVFKFMRSTIFMIMGADRGIIIYNVCWISYTNIEAQIGSVGSGWCVIYQRDKFVCLSIDEAFMNKLIMIYKPQTPNIPTHSL